MLTLALALLQAPVPIARVEVAPPTPEVTIGQTLQLTARALDGNGQPVPGARIGWFSDGEGDVDSTGLVRGGFQGYISVTAAASVPGMARPVFGIVRVRVLPGSPARVALDAPAGPLLVGSRLTLTGTAYTAQNDRRHDPLTFSSSNARVASVTPDGRLRAVAPGRATITARAGSASATVGVQVIPATLSRLEVEPGSSAARTGDVVRFKVAGRSATGRAVDGLRGALVGRGRRGRGPGGRERRLRGGAAGALHRHRHRRRLHRRRGGDGPAPARGPWHGGAGPGAAGVPRRGGLGASLRAVRLHVHDRRPGLRDQRRGSPRPADRGLDDGRRPDRQ
ncbi:MAG: Ig-like domain-containing protein [Gemmatimonadetes bacterium]|nr:Ig-like domain-containing protein [Gemmatimonadota bacterium]